MDCAERTGFGLWMLEGAGVRHGGCVQILPDAAAARCAHVIYLLDPALWGHGLATRIARTAITAASVANAVRS
jgi:RimJ/RimL family protein N-acetyltransferase